MPWDRMHKDTDDNSSVSFVISVCSLLFRHFNVEDIAQLSFNPFV